MAVYVVGPKSACFKTVPWRSPPTTLELDPNQIRGRPFVRPVLVRLLLHNPLVSDCTNQLTFSLDIPAVGPDAPRVGFKTRHDYSLSTNLVVSCRICVQLHLLQRPDTMFVAHRQRERRDCSIPPQFDSIRSSAPWWTRGTNDCR